jgi:hypothetical protein
MCYSRLMGQSGSGVAYVDGWYQVNASAMADTVSAMQFFDPHVSPRDSRGVTLASTLATAVMGDAMVMHAVMKGCYQVTCVGDGRRCLVPRSHLAPPHMAPRDARELTVSLATTVMGDAVVVHAEIHERYHVT